MKKEKKLTQFQQRLKEQKQRSFFQDCLYFIYNPDEKSFLGRTFVAWIRVILLYIAFYSFLSMYWYSMFLIFDTQFIEDSKPR